MFFVVIALVNCNSINRIFTLCAPVCYVMLIFLSISQLLCVSYAIAFQSYHTFFVFKNLFFIVSCSIAYAFTEKRASFNTYIAPYVVVFNICIYHNDKTFIGKKIYFEEVLLL